MLYFGVLFFSTQNLIKILSVVHASEPCFELFEYKSKPTNNACDFETRDSYKKIFRPRISHLRTSETDFIDKIKNQYLRVIFALLLRITKLRPQLYNSYK